MQQTEYRNAMQCMIRPVSCCHLAYKNKIDAIYQKHSNVPYWYRQAKLVIKHIFRLHENKNEDMFAKNYLFKH